MCRRLEIMGCIVKPQKSLELKENVSEVVMYELKETISYVGSIKKPLQRCLKIQLTLEDYGEIIKEMHYIRTHSVSCADQIELLLSLYQQFNSSMLYYQTKIHGICLNNFKESICILLIYLNLNYAFDENSVQSQKSSPFLAFFIKGLEKNEVFKAWNDYINILQSIVKDTDSYESFLNVKFIHGVVGSLHHEQNLSSLKKIKRILSKIIFRLENMFKTAKETLQTLKNFSFNLENELRNIQVQVQKAEKLDSKNPCKLVHFIYE